MEPPRESKTPAESNDTLAEKKHLFDDPKNVKRVIRTLFGLCGVLIILDLGFHRHHSFEEGVFPVEGWFGFYAIYGWVACVLLVLAAKEVLRKLVMRAEDYYER